MATFDEALIATASAFSDMFGETITYKPKAGGSREIQAIVTRREVAGIGDAPHGHTGDLEIDVENDATSGISADEVDKGGDLVNLRVRIGEAARDRRIAGIISQDAGRIVLAVR